MYTGTYKLGINLMGGTGLSVDDHVAMLKRIGWDGFFTGWEKNLLPEYQAAAEKYGIIWQSIHAPFHQVRYMWNEGEPGEQVTAELIECVKDCAAHNVPVMVIHPFIGFEEHDPTEVGLANFGRIIEAADTLGVRLGFENVEGEEYLQAIFERYAGHPSLGFCLDTGHLMLAHKGGHGDFIRRAASRLKALHITDVVGENCDHVLPMVGGRCNWSEIISALREINYQGLFNYEIPTSSFKVPLEIKKLSGEYACRLAKKMLEIC